MLDLIHIINLHMIIIYLFTSLKFDIICRYWWHYLLGELPMLHLLVLIF